VATSTGSATPSSGRQRRPARHNFSNAILSDQERSHDRDRRAIVQGSDQDHDMLRFPMMSQWTCHRPKRPHRTRSSGLCPPRTRPSAKIGRRARLRALNIRTGRVTLGTLASGRQAIFADGPGSTIQGGQKERWRVHWCHVQPSVSGQPSSDELITEKREGFQRHQPA